MTNTTNNVMSVAPVQSSTSTRTTSQGAQQRYGSAARHGRRNFSSTLDQVHAKLDELKQSVQDLQGNSKKLAQVEDDAKAIDTATETSAQGTSDKPQDAETAISNEELEIRNDSEVIAEKEFKPADIFFGKNKPVESIRPFDVPFKPDANKSVAKTILPREIIIPVENPDSLEGAADNSDNQAAEIFTASSMAYLFGMNAETLLVTKSFVTVEVQTVSEVREVPDAPNLMTIIPQAKDNNAQSMLNMLGGRSWRPLEPPPPFPPVEIPIAQVQTTQPSLQAQPVEIQPAPVQTTQPSLQAQPVEIQPAPVQTTQPSLQAQPVEIQPAPVQTTQPSLQAHPVEIQSAPVQTEQPSLQLQPVEVQPAQVQTTQPSLQAQPVEIQSAQIQTTQPTLQTQPVETQPVEIQPAQVQTTQPSLQAQPVEIQPAQVQTTQPSLQAQPVEIQPAQVQTTQPSLQTQPVEIQPAQVQTTQPSLQTQPVEIQPAQVQTTQPSLQAQSVEIQPARVQTTQPNLQSQPVEIQPSQVQTTQPSLQAQPVEIQPAQVQTTQPTLQSQSVEIQPAQVQTTQPTLQSQPVEMQPAQVQTTQPTLQSQPVEIQSAQVQMTQPVITPQRIDERPTVQNFSELLGVNVQVEDAPTTAPVTPPQSTPQQFNQEPQQRDAQNFQNQTFQATTDAQQVQQVSTGGEIFTVPLTMTNEPSQPQPISEVQVPDAPPPPPQDDFDVPAQIIRQARLIRTAENTEMVIKLNPEHLGDLTLKVSVSSSGAVNASFHSDNAQVRTIIENALVQLRQELNNVGLKVENVDVYAGLNEDSLMNGQGGQAWQQNRQQRGNNRRIDLDSLERDVDTTTPVNESTSEGVDYSV